MSDVTQRLGHSIEEMCDAVRQSLIECEEQARQWPESIATQHVPSLRAVLAYLEASRWRPIAEAPKDGTKIDLFYPYPRGRVINCYWGGPHSAYGGKDGWVYRTPLWGKDGLLPEGDWSLTCFPNIEPTHWRTVPSLPAPPREEARDHE